MVTLAFVTVLALSAADAGVAPARSDAGATDAGRSRATAEALTPDAGALLPRSPDGGLPPPGLACLPTWYAGSVVFEADGGWGFRLPPGQVLPWSSHHGEADSESEAAPDLEAIYETPYVKGPIVPVDTSDAGAIHEAGRVRVEQLFMTTYGASLSEVQTHLGRVRFFGLRWPFHERAVPAMSRVVSRLEAAAKEDPKVLPFLHDIGGTWTWRHIARSRALSTHAWGIAIDLNADRAHYWRWQRRGEPLRWQNKVPQAVVDAFEAEGFIWGGRWVHFDTMHFEYRPELLSPTCREPR